MKRFPSDNLRVTDQQSLDEYCKTNSGNSSVTRLTISGNLRGYKDINFENLNQLPGLIQLLFTEPITQEQLKQVSNLSKLEGLSIDDSSKLENIEPLSKLTKLKELTISVPMSWGSRYMNLPDLWPLENLELMEWLNLAGIKLEKDSLMPLNKMQNLKQLDVISTYKNEAAGLKDQNPELIVE